MSGEFQKKTTSIFLTFLIGLIIISFAFSQYDIDKVGGDVIAKVGPYRINYKEFQLNYERNLQLYRQFMGGQDLSAKQRKEMRIEESTIQQLVGQKLMLVFGDKLGISTGEDEVRDAIRDFSQNGEKIFITDGRFNVELYKRALQNAGISPTEFEEENLHILKGKKVSSLLEHVPVSEGHIQMIDKLREGGLTAAVVQINKNSLEKHLPVALSEIQSFLKDKENEKRARTVFEERKERLDRSEEIKLKQIVVRITPGKESEAEQKAKKLAKEANSKNFAELAKKNSDEPNAKKNGGDIPWLGKKQLPKDLVEPLFAQGAKGIIGPLKTEYGYLLFLLEGHRAAVIAKFEDHSSSICTELIQKSKRKELDSLSIQLRDDLQKHLEKGDEIDIQKLKTKYAFEYYPSKDLNRFDGLREGGPISMKDEDLKKIFSENLMSAKTYLFEDLLRITILRASPKSKTSELTKNATNKIKLDLKGNSSVTADSKDKNEVTRQAHEQLLLQGLQKDLMSYLREKVKVKVFRPDMEMADSQ